MSQSTTRGKNVDVGTESPSKSEYDWLFTEPRCRMTLDVLEASSTPIDVADVAAELAVEEVGADAVDEAIRTDVELSLHHRHLPRMDRLGVIEYDRATNRITAYR